MNKIVDETLARLKVYFATENYNRMLKFDSTQTTGIGHVAQRSSENTFLFFVGFPDRDLIVIFMMHVGVECQEIGDCLFITDTPDDRDLIQLSLLLTIRDCLSFK